MILANVTFGTLRGRQREELEEAVESYLAALFKGGQICGERFLTWTKGKLNAHVLLASPEAVAPKAHTSWGKKSLGQVVALFGKEPVWKILDDDAGKTPSRWKGAPFLYLFTTAFDWYSPVCRGDAKPVVPLFTLPVSDQIKEDLYGWQLAYRHLDNVWLGSGVVEIPAYRQLADPNSELAEKGRDLCSEIEKKTGIPTFYYLMRYWGKARGEEERVCPACGGAWRTSVPATDNTFREFHFRCDPCRLVSHVGVSTDGRHARIGEFPRAGNDSPVPRVSLKIRDSK